MKKFTTKEAILRAIDAGATHAEIGQEGAAQARHVGSVPFNNMITALNLMPGLNTREDWTRLAGAMIARSVPRNKGKGI